MRSEATVVNGTTERVERRITEVVPKSGLRTFSAEYIEMIQQDLDTVKHGEIGKILRREGSYSN